MPGRRQPGGGGREKAGMPSDVPLLGLLTVAFEEPVEGGLLAPPTEFLSLVHQSLLDRVLPTEHHDSARPQVDGEHRTIAFTDLMEVGEKVRGGGQRLDAAWDSFL